jgi:hypothetical protein
MSVNSALGSFVVFLVIGSHAAFNIYHQSFSWKSTSVRFADNPVCFCVMIGIELFFAVLFLVISVLSLYIYFRMKKMERVMRDAEKVLAEIDEMKRAKKDAPTF